MDDLDELVRRHKELDSIVESNKKVKPFISDWNCEHPFYLNEFKGLALTEREIQSYAYVRSDSVLLGLISSFHVKRDDYRYCENSILPSNGSVTIIAAFFIWAKNQDIQYIYYSPPVYHAFHFFSKIYNIPLRPITGFDLFNSSVTFNLPTAKSLLVITDPIWYAGYSLREQQMRVIADWQRVTKSLIFVDGSFQYYKWSESSKEYSTHLDPENTFRLVCPSKILATHGFRFSYLLMPARFNDTFDYILDNLLGSANAFDIAFAKECMRILISERSNFQLINYTKEIYYKLIEKKIIAGEIEPDCGYFVFSKLRQDLASSYTVMDGNYFEQANYEGYMRINLLSKCIKPFL